MRPNLLTVSALALTAALAVAPFAAQAQSAFVHADGTPYTTEEKIDALQSEIDLLKRQHDVDQELATSAAAKTPAVTVDKKGLKYVSPDQKYELGLNAQINVDVHSFGGDGGAAIDETQDRLIRLTFSGRAGNASFRIVPEFGGTSSAASSIVDGYVEYKFNDLFNVRAGKFKSPIGLERLQSDPDVIWTERGHSTNLVPNRDVGFQLFGTALANTLEYQVGVFNGAADNQNLNNDLDQKKDIAARVFALPFANTDFVFLQGLGIGWAGTDGQHVGTAASTQLPSGYRTPGQVTFFKYSTGVYSSGKLTRSNPQAYFYLDNFGLLTEFVSEKQDVKVGTKVAQLENSALDVSASWVLTGENLGYKGGVKPAHDFAPGNGGWGALELTARYGYTDIDNDAFAGFASATASASKATSTGFGLAWYLSENLKLLADFDHTEFKGGAATGNRSDEDFASGRIQFRY